MNDNHLKYVNEIISLFERQFSTIYRKLDVKKRARLLPYVSMIYRRWYYSALIEDTPLSPANIVESINLAHGQDINAYPIARLKSQNKYIGIDMDTCKAGMDSHPIVDDMRKLVAYCTPSVDLSDEDGFWDWQAIHLSNRLSLNDPHYASFLLEISLWMELIIKIPSIYANRAQVAKNAQKRLFVSDGSLLREITQTSIKMASSSLNQLIALPVPIFTESFVLDILKKPMETDNIFQTVYETIGFSLDDLFEPDLTDELDGMDAAFLSGTFMMGILLDKYFFTPFSYYLRLIRPMYVLPFDFEQEMSYFIDSFDSDEEMAAAFFAPCSEYTLTALGLQFFDVNADDHNTVNIPQLLPFSLLEEKLFNRSELMNNLPIWVNQPAYKFSNDFHGGQMVYAFKIKFEADTSLWIQLEVPEIFTLHRIYLETIMRFGMVRNDDYSFFHDEIESPFTEYPSQKRARRSKKTAETSLNELDFTYKKTMILSAHNQSLPFSVPFNSRKKPSRAGVKFIIDIMDIKPRESGKVYPAITKASRNLKDLFRNEQG